MRVTVDNNYGADADGNRGIKLYQYELEESDREDIVDQIEEADLEYWDDSTELTISLVCPHTEEDIEFNIRVKDYK